MMKNRLIRILVVIGLFFLATEGTILSVTVNKTLQKRGNGMSLVGKPAPMADVEFQAARGANVETISLNSFPGMYKILFFYPQDRTFVCPTELLAFQQLMETPEFKELNAVIIAASVDSVESHLDWLQTPVEKGGINKVTYPIIADPTRALTRAYQVAAKQENGEDVVALRGLFIIDKNNIVQSMTVNNKPLGRSTAETLRVLTALKKHDETGMVCPANFSGNDADLMKPTEEGKIDWFTTHTQQSQLQ
jgi:peroxiredoxin (alkyl hydroperoxide reductase subunit C)